MASAAPATLVYEPLNVLKPVAEDLWVVDGASVKMNLYVAKLPFPTRMTIVRLQSGELFVHSPTELKPELKEHVDALGPVRHLISPNKLHYAHIGAWQQAYPDAVAWASPGVRERARSQKIDVHFDEDLGEEPPPAWSAELDQLLFRGSFFLEEAVFFHKKTRTLLLADTIQNFEPHKLPGSMRWLARLGGVLDPDGKVPADLRMTFVLHRDEARRSYERVRAWRPQKIVLAHGRWYEHDGERELERAFRWLG